MGTRAEDVLHDLVTYPELNWVIGPGKAVANFADDKGDPIPEKQARWEALKAKYGESS